MKAVGKIANLPAKTREALNRRLNDGQPASVILPWLNALPEVQAVMAERFDGEPVSDQNLSNWRTGGFLKWQADRDEIEGMRELAQLSQEIADAAGLSVIDGTASVAAGLVLKTLRQAHQAATTSPQPADPDADPSQAEALTLNPKLLDGIAKLQAAATMRKKLDLDERKVGQKDRALDLAEAQYQRRYALDFIQHAADEEARKIATGSGTQEHKAAALIKHFFGEMPANIGPVELRQPVPKP